MKFRDFKIGWRLLVQEPAYSAVVILGLAIGFATCFLLLGFVKHSLSYDSHIPGNDRIYEVKTRFNFPGQPPKWNAYASLAIREALLVSGMNLMVSPIIGRSNSMRVGDVVQTVETVVVDNDLQKILGIVPVAGDLQAALTRPDALALTVQTATKLFGTTDVLGKTVQISGEPYTVLALLPDPLSTSTLPYASLAGHKSKLFPMEPGSNRYENWSSSNGGMYVKLGEGVTPEAVIKYLDDALARSPWRKGIPSQERYASGEVRPVEFKLGVLNQAYFDPDTVDSTDPATHGNRQIVYGLAVVGVLILILAATNYVNLATVRTLRRQREIGVRKVLGASVSRVTSQFLAESVLVSALATLLGLLLAWLLLPLFADLVNRKLDNMFTLLSLGASVLLALVVGLASGAYPAWVATHVRPTQALAGRGASETAGGLWLRRVLTVLQFATAMGLTGLTLAIVWQTYYATEIDPGFDPTPLLVIDAPDDMRNQSTVAFRDALARLPGVAGVAVTVNPVARNWNTNNSNYSRPGVTDISLAIQGVSPEFFEVYGLKPKAGRVFNPQIDKMDSTDIMVINLAAVKALNFETPDAAVGQFLARGRNKPVQIVGVVDDIRHHSLRALAKPMIYRMEPRSGVMTLRVSGDFPAVQREVEALWQRTYPNEVLNMNRAKSFIALQYADDVRMAKLLTAAAIIAIAIAAFGIYVLSAYSVQRRAREIVLRKLYGASRRAIGLLVGKEFMTLIGVGALIGLPIAGLATRHYLAGFVDQAPIGIWTLLFALAVASGVAFISTLRHTVGAMRISPAQALRA